MASNYANIYPLLAAISSVKSYSKQYLTNSFLSSFKKKTYQLRYKTAERDFIIVKSIIDYYDTKQVDEYTYEHGSPLIQHIRGIYDNCAYFLRNLSKDDKKYYWKRKYYTERHAMTAHDMEIIKSLEAKYFND